MSIRENFAKIKNIMIAIFILLLALRVIWVVGPSNSFTGDLYKSSVSKMPSFVTYSIDENNKIEQLFQPKYARLQNIELAFMNVGDDRIGELYMQLLDDNGKNIWSTQYPIEELKAGSWETFQITRSVEQDVIYRLVIWAENTTEPVQVMVINAAFAVKENKGIVYQGQEAAGGLAIAYEYKTTYSLIGRVMICLAVGMSALFIIGFLVIDDFISRLKAICLHEHELKTPVYFFLLTGVFFLWLYGHVYQLYDVPYGINLDEMGMGYDAWCVATFGVDRYLKSYPVYLVNFTGGQSVLYMYLVAILIKIFGYSEHLLRVPAVINSVITLFFGGKIVKEQWKKRSYVLLFATLYSILPIFIMLMRVGLDCNLMLGMTTMFLYCLIKMIKEPRKRWYVATGISAGIALYTYALSYLIMPAFLVLTLGYLLYIKKLDIKKIWLMIIPLGLLAMPLVLVQMVNLFDWNEFKIGCFTITKLPEYRGSEISFSHIATNFYTTLKCFFQEDWLYYNSIPKYKTLYWFTISFSIIGILAAGRSLYDMRKQKEFQIAHILFLWFCCMLGTGCLLGDTSGPNCNRLNAVYFVILYFAVAGFCIFSSLVRKQKWYPSAVAVLVISYVVSYIGFTEYYYGRYVEDSYPRIYFDTTCQEALQACQTIENIEQKSIVVQTDSKDEIIYFCGSALPSPYDFMYETGKKEYENYQFLSMGQMQIDANTVYILDEDNIDFAMELENNGFFVRQVGKKLLCSSF